MISVLPLPPKVSRTISPCRLLFFTSLADRLTGFLSKKFPVASEWVIAVFNGSLLILTTALLV